jgi:hypothetical protein
MHEAFLIDSTTLVTFSKLNFQLNFFQCSKIINELQKDKEKALEKWHGTFIDCFET